MPGLHGLYRRGHASPAGANDGQRQWLGLG